MEQPVLVLENVRKVIQSKEIVKGISLDVRPSEVFGFLGPNGAGKTTTIRMIVNLIKPTSGSVKICGFDSHKQFEQAMRHVGCIIESPDMYRYMSGMANLEHFANMNRDITRKRIDEVVELVGLTGRIHDKVEEYSTGMCQRLGLAQAIMNKPRLLILDEPTNGLDPSGIREFRDLVRFLAEQEQMGIFVSSHILSEIQLMCDRVAFIRGGKLLQTGAVKDFIEKEKTVWHVSDVAVAADVLKNRWGLEVELDGQHRLSAVLDDDQVADINQELIRQGAEIYYVYKESRTLEDIFLELTS